MTREELIIELTPIVREVFGKEELVVSDNLDASNVETWTSLSFMHLLSEIEGHFSFKFKMFELVTLHNMGAIINATLNHINK